MNTETRVKVWDLGVRVFHWSLVILFVVSYLSGEEDDSMLHIYSGYGVLALIVFRVVWGFIGTRHARFSDFVHGPRITVEYAKSMLSGKPRHYLGHNPLGGWMVVVLLLALAGTTWSGLEAYGAEGHGPLAGEHSFFIQPAHAHGDENHESRGSDSNEHEKHEGDEFWEEVHEAFVNSTLLLIFLHIAGVIASSVLHRENLARAMVTGYKDADKT